MGIGAHAIDQWSVGQLVFTRTRHQTATTSVVQAGHVAILQIVITGAVSAVVRGRTYKLTSGVAMFTPAGVPRRDNYSAGTECLLVEIPRRMALDDVVADRTARAWAVKLSRELLTREPGWLRIAEGLTLEGLGHLERMQWLSSSRPPWVDDAVELARKDHSLATIAARLGKHPSHVAREFRRHEGVSIGEYGRRCRLELASNRLRTTEESIADVALALGFCDQSHFTNAFHRVFGITPAEFRRTARSRCEEFALAGRD